MEIQKKLNILRKFYHTYKINEGTDVRRKISWNERKSFKYTCLNKLKQFKALQQITICQPSELICSRYNAFWLPRLHAECGDWRSLQVCFVGDWKNILLHLFAAHVFICRCISLIMYEIYRNNV